MIRRGNTQEGVSKWGEERKSIPKRGTGQVTARMFGIISRNDIVLA